MRIEVKEGAVHSSVPRLACWRILYVGEQGKTFRTIHVLKVRPRMRQLDAFCELRMALRTFVFDYIARAYDLETSKQVDLDAWLLAYARSRRRPRVTSRTDPESIARKLAVERVKSLLPL